MKVAAYVRVSSARQVKEGFSIESQMNSIHRFCELKGMPRPDFFIDEGLSGREIKHRPKLKLMMDGVKSGKYTDVVIYSLSRLGRNTVQVINLMTELEKNGVTLNSITDSIDTNSAFGKFALRLLSSLAELESDLISERVTEVITFKKVMGQPYSAPMFGFKTRVVNGKKTVVTDAEGKMVADERDVEKLKTIYGLHLAGFSHYQIEKYMKQFNYRTRRNKHFSRKVIGDILGRIDYYKLLIPELENIKPVMEP